MMYTPLAWLNLLHDRMRTMVAVSGVAFAVVLIFMQLGFLGAVANTARLVYRNLNFDIVIRSPDYLHLAASRSIPQAYLLQAESVPGVAKVDPLYVGLSQWQDPHKGDRRGILVLGVRPGSEVFKIEEMNRKSKLLDQPRFLLIDRASRPDFGPTSGKSFSEEDNGVEPEVGGRKMRIVGNYEMGSGLAADGGMLVNNSGFARVVPTQPEDDVNLGLVQIEPGQNAETVAAALSRKLEYVEVKTRGQTIAEEVNRWVWGTSIGIIFFSGVVVALLVGTAIVYQVLSSDVNERLPEYATLKAMGYRDTYLWGVVILQAVILAIAGFIPGVLIAWGAYLFTSWRARLPIEMTLANFALVFALTLAMCIFSALAALRKLSKAQPADLF